MRLRTARRSRVATAVLSLLTGLALAGCTSSGGGSAAATATATPVSPTGSAAPSTPAGAVSSAQPSSPSDTSTETPVRDPGEGVTPGGGGTAGTGEIGQTAVTYPSGITVGIASAVQYTPGSQAIGTAAGNTGVVLTVRVTNGSSQPLDTEYLTVALRSGPELEESAQIFDAANDYGIGLTGTIAAGETARADYAFDLPPSGLSLLNVVVTPDLRSPRSAVFTGSATPAGGGASSQSSGASEPAS